MLLVEVRRKDTCKIEKIKCLTLTVNANKNITFNMKLVNGTTLSLKEKGYELIGIKEI